VTQNPIGHGHQTSLRGTCDPKPHWARTTKSETSEYYERLQFPSNTRTHTTQQHNEHIHADKLADNDIRKKAAPGPRERAAIKARYEAIISDPNFRPRNDFPVGRQKFVEFVNEHFGEGPLPPPHLQVLRGSNTTAQQQGDAGRALGERITGVETPGEQLASRITGVETPGEQLAARITGVDTPGDQLAARITGASTPGEQLAARITGRTVQTPGEQLAARISGAPQTQAQQAGRRTRREQNSRLNKRGGIQKYHHHGPQ
jgi:hypothetical protein